MLINKWELLKAFTKGMTLTSTGNAKIALNAVVKQMDTLDKEESAEHAKLMGVSDETPSWVSDSSRP